MSVLSLAVIALSVVGCGGDADDGSAGTAAAGTGSGGTAGSDTGGAGGTTGGASGAAGNTTGTGGTAGTATGGGGGTMAAPVECGSETCVTDPAMRFAQACCVNADTSTCGTMLPVIGMCAVPVEPDLRCDSITFMMGISLTIPSCCADGNRCGLDTTMFGGMGCTSLEDLEAMYADDGGTPDGGTGDGGTADGGMMGGGNPFNITLPEAKACE